MYGLMHIAMRDLVTEKLGEEVWKSICIKHGASECPISLQSYPDQLTVCVLAETAGQLGLQMPAMLKEFGIHWINFVFKSDYGEILRFYGPDFKSCIENLNRLHASVGHTMHDAQTPQFELLNCDGHILTVRYCSNRQGLSSLVEGLLTGLLLHFNLNGTVEALKSDISHTDFVVAINE